MSRVGLKSCSGTRANKKANFKTADCYRLDLSYMILPNYVFDTFRLPIVAISYHTSVRRQIFRQQVQSKPIYLLHRCIVDGKIDTFMATTDYLYVSMTLFPSILMTSLAKYEQVHMCTFVFMVYSSNRNKV